MPFLASQVGPVLAQAADDTSGSFVGFLLPLVILGGLFYVLLVLPQRRRQKQQQALRDAVEIGDDVRTVGGIYGRVQNITDADVILDVGGGTTLRIARRAIADRLGADTD